MGWNSVSIYLCGRAGLEGVLLPAGPQDSPQAQEDHPTFGVSSVHLPPQSDKDSLRTAPRTKVLPVFLHKATGVQRWCLGSGVESWIKVPAAWGRRSI